MPEVDGPAAGTSVASRRMDPTVRVATAADVPAAADTLRAAFRDYPFTRHVLGADDHERRLAENQALFLSEIGIPHGRVWVVDGPDGVLDAVAVWTTPGSAGIGDVFARLAPRLAEIAGDRADVAADTEAVLAPHRPSGRTPHRRSGTAPRPVTGSPPRSRPTAPTAWPRASSPRSR